MGSDAILTQFLNTADGYLCELKEAQIRDGLHIFGQCPQHTQLRDLIVAIARNPNANRLGLTRAIALDWEWNFDPLTADFGEELVGFVIPKNPPKSPLERGTLNIDSRIDLDPIPPFLRGARGDSDAETKLSTKPCRIIGDAVEILEEYAAELVTAVMTNRELSVEIGRAHV